MLPLFMEPGELKKKEEPTQISLLFYYSAPFFEACSVMTACTIELNRLMDRTEKEKPEQIGWSFDG